MNELMNGTVVVNRVAEVEAAPVGRRKSRKAKAAAPVAKDGRKRRPVRRVLSARQRVAFAVGAVGCSVLALSVWHCTEALALLTGAPVLLAFLLAVGIDCGLVACEVAGVVGGQVARRAARWYVGLAVALSAVLNAVASGQHAAEGFAVMAYGVGALVPVLVLMLGVVASHLWTEAA
jgi:hypothetical protein